MEKSLEDNVDDEPYHNYIMMENIFLDHTKTLPKSHRATLKQCAFTTKSSLKSNTELKQAYQLCKKYGLTNVHVHSNELPDHIVGKVTKLKSEMPVKSRSVLDYIKLY